MSDPWTSRDWANVGKAYIVARLERVEAERDALLARALLAESQRDYWIGEAERHGHGPSADEVPFSDPEPPSAAEVEECLEEVGDD